MQKEKWEGSRVKRPANSYMQFMKSFMSKNAPSYDNVCDVVSAGNTVDTNTGHFNSYSCLVVCPKFKLSSGQKLAVIMPPPYGGGIKRYRDPSVCLSHGAAALGAHLP